jgi:uncharacterized integral membrane protein (TIGR00698 family)
MIAGVLMCLAIAGAATGAGVLLGLPAVLLALLLGFAVRALPVNVDSRGVDFCAGTLLQVAIALIGLRLPLSEITSLGAPALALGIGAVVGTVAIGTLIGRALGLSAARAALSAGAVAICGSSAALAVAAVLPKGPSHSRDTVYTIASVTLLSTAAMVLYPAIAGLVGLSDVDAGMFFGASIHNLAQVIGAGAIVSADAANAATVTKLVRILCLAPAVLAIGCLFRAQAAQGEARPPALPGFIIAFGIAVMIANAGLVPPAVLERLSELAELCLVAATAALGLKTSPGGLMSNGWRPLAAVLAQTALLAVGALTAVLLIRA